MVKNSYFHWEYCNEELAMRLQCIWGVPTKAVRRGKNKKTKGNNTQTQVRQMWPAMRGLQLFIMKGIHCSVPALPLSTQFFHTGPPSLLFVPSLVSVPLFFFRSSTILYQFSLGWSRSQGVEWGRGSEKKLNCERERVTKGADLQDSLETSVRPCLSLLLPPIPSSGGGLCTQERLLYLGICGAPLGGLGGGGRVGSAIEASAPL